jgi:two-component system NtrC family sensor kinase
MAHIITERKEAEEQLRHSEEYFRSLIENAQDGIAIVNAEGTILYESPAVERMLGYKLREHVGENALLFAHQDDLPMVTEALAQMLQTPGGFVQTEARVWHKDGSLRTVEVVGHNLLDNPSVGGIVANVRDITERRRAEEDREKMEQQLQLAGRLAAVGELAADLAESLRKDTAIIHREAQRAARVTANLLSFARRSVPEKSLISINDVLEKSLELHAYRMKVNNIEVKYELDPGLPRTMADFHQLQQVGKGNLTVKTQSLSRMIRTSFIDDGPGIGEEDLQKIFDPFYTTKAVGKGTGLGLSISFGIMQDHGGRLYARSKPGKGTTFIVEIPIISES